MLVKPLQDVRDGDRIVLPEFDNGEAVEPTQHAIVNYVDGGMLYCQIVESDRTDASDDGWREISLTNLPSEIEVW